MDKWFVSVKGYGEFTITAFNYSNATYRAYEEYRINASETGDNKAFDKFKRCIEECYKVAE